MTLRDNITHGRAKGLWTGTTMHSTEVPLGRKARYGTVSGRHVFSFACFGSVHGIAATYKARSGAAYADFTLEPSRSTEGGSRRPV